MHTVWYVVLIIVLLTLIAVTQLAVRTQRLATYWIEPLALLVLCWMTIEKYTGWRFFTAHGWYIVGAVVGIIIGTLRGRATKVELGAEPGTFTAQGSWITVAILATLTCTNVVARLFLEGQAGVDVQRVTSPLLLVTAFNMIAWRAVMVWKFLELEQARSRPSSLTQSHP
ncbi:MAG TPA: hypothetical protein VKF82_01605 [Candidatus Eremiobacteraceae bacterium]|nr:hypothetical protein [Candidatus Eremiobacteraceae bacterium]